MKVKYIGNKPFKTDNVAATGLVWNGNGDVQEVPDDKAALLIRHTAVWEPAGNSEHNPHTKTLLAKHVAEQRRSEDDSLSAEVKHSDADLAAANARNGVLDPNDKLMLDWAKEEGIEVPEDPMLRGKALEDFLTDAIGKRTEAALKEAQRLGAQHSVADAGSKAQIAANKEAHQKFLDEQANQGTDPTQAKVNEAIHDEEAKREEADKKAKAEQAAAATPNPKIAPTSTKAQAQAHKVKGK